MTADILEELGLLAQQDSADAVADLGGDVLDELAVIQGKPEDLSPRFTQQQISPDDARREAIQKLNDSMSTAEKFLVGAGRGFTNVARGLGLAEQEDPLTRQAANALTDDSLAAQAGQIIGEASPFLAAAPAAGLGLTTSAGKTIIPAAQSLGAKVVGTGILGATEGAVVTRGGGGNAAETAIGGTIGGVIGGIVEAVSPVLGRMGNAIFKQLGRKPSGPLLTPEGAPTPEFTEVLNASGTDFETLTREAIQEVNAPNVNIQQAERAARFTSEGVPATRGDITQNAADQASEQRLLSQATGDAPEPLRQLKLNQSEIIIGRVNEVIDGLGVPSEAGDSIKDALINRKSLLREEKNRLYKEVFDASPEVRNIPLFTGEIAAAVPEERALQDLAITAPQAVDQVKAALSRFGVTTGDEAGEVLTIGNFDRLRRVLGNIDRADQTGAAGVMTGPIREALDKEADNVIESSAGSAIAGDVLESLKKARGIVRQTKTEFSPDAIVGKLTRVKRDGDTPFIEASKAANELLRPSAPIEHLERTLSSLRKSGDKGIKAIGDLQASAVMNALEASLKAPSRKTGGVQTLSGNEFTKSLNKLGDDKLKLLFKGNEKVLNRLQSIRQIAVDAEPSAVAIPRGSAPVILDIINRASALPGLAVFRDLARFVRDAGADDRAVKRALDAKPEMKRIVSQLESQFPSVVTAIGVASATSQQED